MKEKNLDLLLRNQYLIISVSEQNLDLVNYIYNGYQHNISVLSDNRFFHAAAFAFYRNVVIDIHCLFAQPTSSHKNSLFHISKLAKGLLQDDSIIHVRRWLAIEKGAIEKIKKFRDEQLAHYDLTDDPAIHVNFEQLPALNRLHRLAKKIVEYCGHHWIEEEKRVGFMLGTDNDYLSDLKELIEPL
jgi:hypothetical protein